MTLTSTNAQLHGSHGYAENVNAPPLVGGLWCEFDGKLWYLQSSPASGNLPIMTAVTPKGNAPAADAPKRYAVLQAVAPSS